MGTLAGVVLDGVDVTQLALEGQVTTKLSAPGTAQVKLPMESAFGGAGSMLKIYFETDLDTTPQLWHHGRVLTCEDSADENGGYTVYNSSDPLELWNWRPVRDADGNFINPSIITDNDNKGPAIIQAMLMNSDNGGGDDDSEGPTRLAIDFIAEDGVDLYATPTDWPMTMAQLAALLVSTGEVDIVVKPIEFDMVGNYGEISVYNGRYGEELQDEVIFQYGMGAFNIRALRRNEDMSRMCNKLWYFLGPRVTQNRWLANVTATQNFTKDFSAPGGLPEIDPSPCPYDAGSPDPYTVDVGSVGDLAPTQDTVRGHIARSRGETSFASAIYDPLAAGSFDVRMDIRVFADRDDEATLGYCMFKKLWLEEQWLRLAPQTLVHITPTRDTAIGTFGIGDLVTVEAHADVRGGFTGVQRVYSYTISWDADSVPAIGELQVSSDNEGFPAG